MELHVEMPCPQDVLLVGRDSVYFSSPIFFSLSLFLSFSIYFNFDKWYSGYVCSQETSRKQILVSKRDRRYNNTVERAEKDLKFR